MNKHHHLNFTVTSLIFWLTLPFSFLRFLLICQNPVGVILIRSFMSVLFLIFYKCISDGSLSFTKILSREKLMFKWVMSLCLYVGKVPFERSYVPLLIQCICRKQFFLLFMQQIFTVISHIRYSHLPV